MTHSKGALSVLIRHDMFHAFRIFLEVITCSMRVLCGLTCFVHVLQANAIYQRSLSATTYFV